MAEEKLSKKQQKALQFKQKKTKEERDEEKNAKKRSIEEVSTEASADASSDKKEASDATGETQPKKRKTRRGKKGKAVNGGKGPRFILFIGNLPYDIQQSELVAHFKNSNPDRFRIRQDKGIAFMEFDNDTKEIQSKMELALKMHHTVLRNRKINVELTVGGGGNSEARLAKLKDKNEVLLEERRTRISKEKTAEEQKKEAKKAATPGVHPSRAALMK